MYFNFYFLDLTIPNYYSNMDRNIKTQIFADQFIQIQQNHKFLKGRQYKKNQFMYPKFNNRSLYHYTEMDYTSHYHKKNDKNKCLEQYIPLKNMNQLSYDDILSNKLNTSKNNIKLIGSELSLNELKISNTNQNIEERLRFIKNGTIILPRFSEYKNLPGIENFSKGMRQIVYEDCNLQENYKNIKVILERIRKYKK